MIEQEILDVVRQLDEIQKRRVLEFVQHIQGEKVYSARELMKLPLEERQRLVEASLAAAADEDFEIFEAYTEETFDDDHSTR